MKFKTALNFMKINNYSTSQQSDSPKSDGGILDLILPNIIDDKDDDYDMENYVMKQESKFT